MVLSFFSCKKAILLRRFDKMTEINEKELDNIKRNIEDEFKTKSKFKITK